MTLKLYLKVFLVSVKFSVKIIVMKILFVLLKTAEINRKPYYVRTPTLTSLYIRENKK